MPIDDEKVIEECFYKDLKFGTGGIRAIMGPGPNKLNKYTIRKNTEGFARFIEGLPPSNVIKLFLEDGSWVVIRPSGNEPKIKYYKNLWKR